MRDRACGGRAFGAKSQTYPEYITIAYLARMLDRPVRWIEDWRESLTAASHGRAQVRRARIAATKSGEILALEATVNAETGAYPHTGTPIPMFTAWVLSEPFRATMFSPCAPCASPATMNMPV